jgi:hypothetical protein
MWQVAPHDPIQRVARDQESMTSKGTRGSAAVWGLDGSIAIEQEAGKPTTFISEVHSCGSIGQDVSGEQFQKKRLVDDHRGL